MMPARFDRRPECSSRLSLAVGLSVVSAAVAGVACSEDVPMGPVPPSGFRATFDRPDDFGGAQLHVIYGVCDDCPDQGRDTTSYIESQVALAASWLRSRTGLEIRIDTFEGQPDVSFLRIPGNDGALQRLGSALVDRLYERADDRSFDAPGKKYLIFYEGNNEQACASAIFGGRAAAIYLRAPQFHACTINRRMILHEVLHTFGFVDPNAPGHDPLSPGHVKDTRDLMSGRFLGEELDPGGNDYFGDNVPPGVKSLDESPYLGEREGSGR